MKTPGIFSLTKREQRTAILILLAIVAGSAVLHYRDLVAPMPTPRSTSPVPAASGLNEEPATPDESH